MNDETTTATASTEWLQRLSELVLAGMKVDDAIDRCRPADIPPDAAVREATEWMSDPRFEIGVLAAMRLQCREWWHDACATLAMLDHGPSTVDECDGITRDEFVRKHYAANKPLCIRGFAAQWPALSKWTREYLGAITATVDVMANRGAAPAHQRSVPSRFTKSIPFSEFVDLVYSGANTDDYYLVGKNWFFNIPETQHLLEDLGASPLIRVGEGSRRVRMWFGPGGTVTPIHYDGSNTLMVQIAGRKSVRLYSPLLSRYMEQRRRWYGEVDPEELASNQRDEVPGTTIVLSPGDALFLPVGWWHVVRALEVSLTLTYEDFGLFNEFEATATSKLSSLAEYRPREA
jgi:hypothetical protein